MSNKPIIQIQVDDAKFKAFLDLFQKYSEQLDKMPAMWKQVQSAMDASSVGMHAASYALVDAASAMAQLRDDASKTVLDQDKFAKSTEAAAQSTEKIKNTNKKIREDVDFTTKSLLKWLGIGGAFGAGMEIAQRIGGFITGTAGAAVGLSRTAGMMGITPGQLQAANTAYSPYFDVGSLLSNINQIKMDPSKMKTWQAMGLNDSDLKTKNAAELLPEVLQGIQQTFQKANSMGAAGGPYLQSIGMDNLVSTDVARRIAALSDEELKNAQKMYDDDKEKLDLSKETLDTWTHITQQVDLAGASLKNTMIAAATDAYNTIHGKNTEKQDAEVRSNWDTFRAAVKDFMGLPLPRGVSFAQAGAIYSDDFWNTIHPDQQRVDRPVTFGKLNRGGGSGSGGGTGGMSEFISQTASSMGVSPALADFIWMIESNRGKNAGLSSGMALGDFQLKSGTASDMGVTDRTDPRQSAMGGIKYLARLLKEFHGDIEKAVVSYNAGDKTVKDAISTYGDQWRSHLKPEAQKYDRALMDFLRQQQSVARNTRVDIKNDSGGDVNVKASQLPMPYGIG